MADIALMLRMGHCINISGGLGSCHMSELSNAGMHIFLTLSCACGIP